jgi:putative transcriptional regulator
MAKTKAQRVLKGLDDVIRHVKGEESGLRITQIVPPEVDVKLLRHNLHLSQSEFAERYGFPVATVRNWEQGRRKPEGAARLLLKLIASKPGWVDRVLREEHTASTH